MNRKPFWMVIGALAVLVLSLGAYKYWRVTSLMAQAAAFPEPAESVEIASVGEITWQPRADTAGTVLAKQFVRLSNRVAGPVDTVEFQSGQQVKQGQVLLRLRSGREQAQLKSALADIKLATTTLERKQLLASQGASSQAELDLARAELEQAVAKAAVLRETIEDLTVRAPFAGRVGLRDVHPGQYLAEGTELTTLQSHGDHVDVDFRLPQEIAAQLAVGGEVSLSGGTLSKPASARIIAIDVRADEASRHVRVRAEVRDLDSALKPGAFVDVSAAAAAPRTVLAVPLSAVRRAAYGDHVYLIEAAKQGGSGPRAVQRFVRAGPVVGSDIVVFEGLALGDRVASNGAFKLREGSLVSISPASTQPTSVTQPQSAQSAQSVTAPSSAPSNTAAASGSVHPSEDRT